MSKLILLLLGWCFVLYTVALGGIRWFPYTPTFPYAPLLEELYGPRWLTNFAHFDGIHYLTIAKTGYRETEFIQAFFPLYPLLIRIFSLGIFNRVVVGYVISVGSLVGSVITLFYLVRRDYGEKMARKTVALFLAFPTFFYLFCVYSESLFFLLSLLTVWFGRQKKWWLAGICGGLAALTRLIGVFLVFYLVYEYFMYAKNKFRLIAVIPLFFPIMGLGIYMIYLGVTFQDPLYFYHVQEAFGAARESDRLILLPQVIFRYIKIMLTGGLTWHGWYTVIHEFVAGVGGVFIGGWGWFKLRRSYMVYMLPALILPTLTGNFSSMPRYLLPLFPLYILLGLSLKRYWFYGLLGGFILLQVINLLLFTRGLWVA